MLYHSNLPIPPGEFLEEVLYDLRMSKDEFFRRMKLSELQVNTLFDGNKPITLEIAVTLEQAIGVPDHIWLGLKDEYRLTLARVNDELDD